ncbi:cation:dicarboxylase symporter family transporter, partial [candidate division KSB1 bacterium]|nr:cation:dicarboxylase symporter family transporter [candidate division KSB1 bacterium]
MILRKLTLTHYIFIGIILGVLCGWAFGESILPLADPLANIFLRLLRMVIIPLIVTSILYGVVSVGSGKGLGTLGL